MMRVRAIVLIAVLSLLVNSCQGLQSNKRLHKNELDHVVESLLQTESATARRSGVGIAGMNPNSQVNTPDTNPVYVLPTDPESAPFGSYLNPQASVSPLQSAFGQYRSPSQVGNVNQMGGGADPTPNANVVGGAGAPDAFFFLETKSTRSRSQAGILGMLQGAMSALTGGGGAARGGAAGGGGHAGGGGGGEGGGGTQPSYLLPTDPNSAPYGKFLNPATNINPLNVNAQYAQGGAGGEGGGEAGGAAPGALVAGNVPIGAAAGSNPASGFPQFLEISAESGVAHQLSHVGDCQNCEYAK